VQDNMKSRPPRAGHEAKIQDQPQFSTADASRGTAIHGGAGLTNRPVTEAESRAISAKPSCKQTYGAHSEEWSVGSMSPTPTKIYQTQRASIWNSFDSVSSYVGIAADLPKEADCRGHVISHASIEFGFLAAPFSGKQIKEGHK